jgi:hypothetical protein
MSLTRVASQNGRAKAHAQNTRAKRFRKQSINFVSARLTMTSEHGSLQGGPALAGFFKLVQKPGIRVSAIVLPKGAHLVAAEAAVPSGFATASKRSPTSLHAIHRRCHACHSFSVPGRFVSTKTTTFRMIWSLIETWRIKASL